MDRAVRITIAFGVLALGIGAAMLFRHRQSAPLAPAGGAGEHLILRQPMGPATTADSPRPGPTPPPAAKPTLVTPQAPAAAPPFLAKEYPGLESASASANSLNDPTFAPPGQPRTHQIVDGDSLRALAQRFLGSAERAQELFDANRDVLTSPDVLPIGRRLKLPDPHAPAPKPNNLMPKRKLAPVAATP